MTTVSVRGFTVIELMLFWVSPVLYLRRLCLVLIPTLPSSDTEIALLALNTCCRGNILKCPTLVTNEIAIKGNEDGSIEQSPVEGEPRGASACVILGRAIEIQDNGTKISTSSVVGREPVGQVRGNNERYCNASCVSSPNQFFDTQDSTVDWGSALSTTNNHPWQAY